MSVLKLPSKILQPDKSLLDYQLEDVKKACSTWKDKSIYLGHEMGLGKTVIATTILAFSLKKRPQEFQALIICPSSVRPVWHTTLLEWVYAPMRLKTQTITKQKDKIASDRNVVIASYELAVHKDIAKQLVSRTWSHVVVDEAHHLGNPKSKITRLVCGSLSKKAERMLFLSGSIQKDKVPNLWPVWRVLCPEKIPKYWEFCERYVHMKEQWFGNRKTMQFLGGKNLPELSQLAKENFLIRRRKKDVLKSLPDKLEQKINLEIPELEQQRLAEASLDFAKDLEAKLLAGQEPKDENLAQLRNELGLIKVPYAVDYILAHIGELQPDEPKKVVVFCYHRAVYFELYKAIEKHLPVVGISGETPHKIREQAVKHFQEGEAEVFIGTYAAAEGITLHAASTAFIVEMSWSLNANEQAPERLHRIGQKNTVYVNYLLAPGTIDDVVFSTFKRKLRDKNKAIDGKKRKS